MKLRTRLIVAFLVLSVGPLAAVTYFSYTTQAKALQDLATREADALSSEMTQRMQLVTTELSARVEQLAGMQESDVVRVAQRRTTPADAEMTDAVVPPAAAAATPPVPPAAEAPATPVTPAASVVSAAGDVAQAMEQNKVAEALGAAAMLLQTVELQGMRPRPPSGDRTDAGVRTSDPGGRGGDPRFRSNGRSGRGAPRPGGSGTNTPPPVTGDTGTPTTPPPTTPAAPAPAAAPKVVIDMGSIAREMFRQYMPEGGFDKMTPEQRQELAREINLRMVGIAEGIKLGAAELQKKADEARKEASVAAVTPPDAPPAAPAPPQPPAPTTPATTPRTPAKPVTSTSKLVGNKLDVTLMQDGQVVGSANATIDLENVLATVFSPTRRESGEVPFAVAPDGKVYTVTEADRKTVEDLGPIARPDGPLGKTTLPDWVVFTTQDPSGSGLRFGIARPVGDSLDALRRTVGRNAGFGLLLVGILTIGVVPLSGRLTKDLTSLTEGVDRIAHGDYRARVPVRGRDEIAELATAFNKMAADVERHQHAMVEQERLRRELELGRRIQSEMLPHEPLSFGLTEVQGVSIPAREVGGDFFNYFVLDNGHVALVVGDVSGKGVGAALLMANIQASLRTRLALGQNLSAIAEALDHEMTASSGSLYVTLFLGIFDPVNRRLEYVNAGHNPQFVLRANQPLEKMDATGIPMGLLSGRGYAHREVQLSAGDLLFFYTDGCVESENEADEMFGADRLEALLVSIAAAAPSTPDRVLRQVEEAVTAFRGTREPNDDATMMAVRIG
ncbi:MAG: hypothetical protein AMXMBFR57_06980 [Acidimicrobiia bacterium]